MKLNQKLLEQLRNGEIAVENSGTLEQLREVLKAAFPEDSVIPSGNAIYYSRSESWIYGWTGSQLHINSKPTFKISDFYQPDLFTGWAKDDRFPEWMVYFKDEIAQYGFDGCEYEWISGVGMYRPRYSEIEDNRPATHKEIEKGLTEEAKRRGFRYGVKIKSPWLRGVSSNCISDNFVYYPESNELASVTRLSNYTIFKDGQWAEIIEQPSQVKTRSNPIHYTVGGTTYSLNYQELKYEYNKVIAYRDEEFMDNLPEIAHLACIVAYFKGLGSNATIGDKGIIHELLHLMTSPDEPTNDLQDIREKFNRLIQLV